MNMQLEKNKDNIKDNIIEIVNLTKNYNHKNQTYALSKINLTIQTSDIYGIIGASGAGKSTLMRCLVGLTKPTAGQIKIYQQDIAGLTKAAQRKFYFKIGMVFQQFNLFLSRTVAENISYPLEIFGIEKKLISIRVAELLELVGLTAKAKAYPAQLSGGEKQRVGIARALANSPSILFCDEATSALDPKTTQEILNLLKMINTKLGVTIVLITHEMAVIKQICHKVAVLSAGEIIEAGCVADIFFAPKTLTTQQLLQNSVHELPIELLGKSAAERQLLRLKFKGHAAQEPIISNLVKHFAVEINILLGWIDNVQNIMLGTLIVEILGETINIQQALEYLETQQVHYEFI